jgi:hypothetical protein
VTGSDARLHSSYQEPVRPLIPGYAVANPGNSFGTIGCVVKPTGFAGPFYILSAAHVIAWNTYGHEGLAVVQPGVHGQPERTVASLKRWGALHFSHTEYLNLFDAAIAEVTEEIRPEIPEIGRPLGYSATITKGMRLRKCGATTALSAGAVREENYKCFFPYRTPSGGKVYAGFYNQILCEKISEPGDSGAAVVNDAGRIVGLVVGTADGGTVVSRIVPILSRLGVTLV